MNKFNRGIGVLVVMLGAPLVSADHVTVCKHDAKVREIHVVYDVEGQSIPCAVNYVKDSGEQTLWRAENLEGYCEEQAAAFVAKQESWGWTCEAQADASGSMVEEEAPEPESEGAVAEEEEADPAES